MRELDALSADQRALLELLLEQRKTYAELSTLLGIDASAVQARAHRALDALSANGRPQLADGRRAQVADYLLGQQTTSEREATGDYLARSAAARTWERRVTSALRPVAAEPMPSITEDPAPELPVVEPAASSPQTPVMASKHAYRFRVVVGALLGIAIGAVAASLMLAAGQGPGPDSRWSAWHPRSSAVGAGAQQIADHVAPSYRQVDGDQMVGVTGGPLKVGQLNLAVRIAVADSGVRNIGIVQGKSALYTLCGLGPRCAISRGKATNDRGLLLRREALELALYSFRYLDDVDSVVALMPPAKGQKPQKAVFFRRSVLQPALDRPLPQTLPSPPPTVAGLVESPQASLVKSVTNPSVFCFSFEPSQDLGAFLVLQKPTADPKKPCQE